MTLLLRRFHPAVAALAVLAAAAAPATAAGAAVAAEATVVVPAGAETEIKARESLRVVALPVEVGQPVAEEAVLVAVDVTDLERAIADAQRRRSTAVKTERDRIVTPNPNQNQSLTRALAEQQDAATRELPELQNRLVNAPVRAPSPGWFVRSLFTVGLTTQKRKPAALFVPLAKSEVELRLAAADAAALAEARRVVVAAQDDPERSFEARVLRSRTEGGFVVLSLEPRGLPFLALGQPAFVTVTAER
jgi:hypothetical protein